MCFYIVSFSAQVVESLKGFGREYRRQVVPEVVHAHLEELLPSKLLGTGARHLAMDVEPTEKIPFDINLSLLRQVLD
jgi:hypothetical protein